MSSLPIPVQELLALRPASTGQQRRRSRISLLNLPNELLLQVIGHLEQHRETLSRLVRVCKRLWRLAIPSLYKKVTVKPDALMSFANNLYRNPQLLEYIENIAVHDHNTIDSALAERLEPLIAHMRNLRHLFIKGQYTQFNLVPQDLVLRHSKLYATALRSPLLSKLEECALSLGHGDPWDMAGRECIFAHPSLRKLCIIGAQMSDFYCFTERMIHTSPLRNLVLYCCDLSPRTLQKILAVPRNLREVTYAGARQVGEPVYTSSRPDEYITAMHVQAESLHKIVFHPWNLRYRRPHAITLHRFTALKSLTLMPYNVPTPSAPAGYFSFTSLVDNGLPASLTTITILHRGPRVLSLVEDGMKRRLAMMFHAGALPNLQVVKFCIPLLSLTTREIHDPPLDWDLYFHGRVRVERATFDFMQQLPLNCECCDFDLYKLSVDNTAVEFTPSTPALHAWLFDQHAV